MKNYKLNLIHLPLYLGFGIALISTSLVGCSTKDSDPQPLTSALTGHQGPSLSLLEQNLESIQKSKFAKGCDQTWAQVKKDLVTAVAHHKEESLKSTFIDAAAKSAAHNDWASHTLSWKLAHDYFQKHEGDLDYWDHLSKQVHELVKEDGLRILNGHNKFINHKNVKQLGYIKNSVVKCLSNADCVELDLKGDTLAAAQELYSGHLKKFENEADKAKKRDLLGKLKSRTEFDESLFKEEMGTQLKSTTNGSKTSLSVTLDGRFLKEADRALIKTTLESVWSKSQPIEIIWGTKQEAPDAFRLVLQPHQSGFAPSTHVASKLITLTPNATVRQIAHEFGHALGFADHYYSVWNASDCEYSQEMIDTDIMSNSETGNVTQEEWDMLMKSVSGENLLNDDVIQPTTPTVAVPSKKPFSE